MTRKTKKRKSLILLIIFILAALTTGWIIWSNVSVKTSIFTIKSDDLPKEFDGFSIAHISDFHNAKYGKNNEKLVSVLKEEKPDMIAITGDFIDSYHTDIECALSFAQQAVNIAPCYFVAGNHEARIGSQYDELKETLEDMGVVVLQDKALNLEYNGASIRVIGLNDPDFTEKDSSISGEILRAKLSQLYTSDGFTLLLSHRPEYFSVYQDAGINLVLSGHAHGGQIRLPFIGGLFAPNQGFFPKYDSGLYAENGTYMVVSSGLGNSIMPVRFNNRPEIIIEKLISDAG